jgi:hypothetical protein
VFVANLSPDVPLESVAALFSGCGRVESVVIEPHFSGRCVYLLRGRSVGWDGGREGLRAGYQREKGKKRDLAWYFCSSPPPITAVNQQRDSLCLAWGAGALWLHLLTWSQWVGPWLAAALCLVGAK